jgi:hypothetical protein
VILFLFVMRRPGFGAMVIVIKFTYRFVEQLEEKLDKACCNRKGHEADSPIRKVTGWFSDMSTAFGGYSLSKIVQYPRLYLDRGYRRSFGGQDLGGEDAGFIAMMYGYATCSHFDRLPMSRIYCSRTGLAFSFCALRWLLQPALERGLLCQFGGALFLSIRLQASLACTGGIF